MTAIELIESRQAVGIATYGVSLTPKNGRDNLRDALEEAADLCCYLRNEINERRGIHTGAHWWVINDLKLGFRPMRENPRLARAYQASLTLLNDLLDIHPAKKEAR